MQEWISVARAPPQTLPGKLGLLHKARRYILKQMMERGKNRETVMEGS